jgi:hypothetical protein
LELRVVPQRTDEDQFGRAVALAVAVADAPMPLRLADAGPVSCTVDRAAIACRINKGFQQQQGLLKMCEPVHADAALA